MKNLRNLENRYGGMTYRELMRASDKAKSGKDARLIHRELKKYGDGLFLWDRHPVLVHMAVILFDMAASVVLVRVILKILNVI